MDAGIAFRIVQTGMLSVDQMMKVGETARSNDVWQTIAEEIDWPQLSVDQMLKVGRDSRESWVAVTRRIDWSRLSADQMMEFGRGAEDDEVWQMIVRTGTLSADQMMEVGEIADDDDDVWGEILRQMKLRAAR